MDRTVGAQRSAGPGARGAVSSDANSVLPAPRAVGRHRGAAQGEGTRSPRAIWGSDFCHKPTRVLVPIKGRDATRRKDTW